MFLFILESIGTPELILIAVVALIVFGPRKLPQMAKTMAKTMAEFRNATTEFRTTWEKEVAFEEENFNSIKNVNPLSENSQTTQNPSNENFTVAPAEKSLDAPEIRELSADSLPRDFQQRLVGENNVIAKEKGNNSTGGKRDWL